MTDVGLDGTQMKSLFRAALAVARCKSIRDRSHLNTVASLGTSSVHLDIADVVCVNTSVGEDLVVQVLLGSGVGVGDRDSLSTVVGRGTENAAKDVVLVRNGILIALEDD